MSANTLQIKLNRLNAQKAAIENKLKQQQRKNRTRTLLQAGSILQSTGLLEFCHIEAGDDLQFEASDKATLLLGVLASIDLEQDRETLMEKGQKILDSL